MSRGRGLDSLAQAGQQRRVAITQAVSLQASKVGRGRL